MKKDKIIKFPKQILENETCDFNEIIEYDEGESWEGDYYYYNKQDWKGLVELREHVATKHPKDSSAQWRLGEAYILNGEFEKALDFLSKLHYKNPENIDIQYSILDALFGLNKNEDDFKWLEKPEVVRLTKDVLDYYYAILKPKRKPRNIYELHSQIYGYLLFNEKELLNALLKDDRFKVDCNLEFVSEAYISIVRKNINKK